MHVHAIVKLNNEILRHKIHTPSQILVVVHQTKCQLLFVAIQFHSLMLVNFPYMAT